MIFSKHIWKTLGLSFIFIFLNIKMAEAQLPDSIAFCSHLKSSISVPGKANIDYSQHDIYDVNFYYLDLKAAARDTYLSGFVEIQATAKSDIIDTIYLELNKVLEVDSVLVNQQKSSFNHTSNHLLLILPHQELQVGELFTTRIYYHGTAETLEGGRGYNSRHLYHGAYVSWTLSEPFYSKEWWPCKQDLQDKADSVWVFISTANKNKVGSNGILTDIVPLDDENHCYQWKSNYPIDYYLISFAIADYMEYSFYSYSQKNRNVWMQNYLYADSAMYKKQKMLIDCTKVEMALLQEKYGDYPFSDEKYGHCITPIGGGMEHQTMTTQRDFNFHLSIHEMGHSWFGNQVTCATWNDIWLNEGFATYTQYLGLENLADRATADAFMAAMQSKVMEKPDGSVYVPESEVDNRDRVFSGRLSYYKGAVIVHMIRYLLHDDDLFFRVLQEYQQRFAYQTASTPDFIEVLEELTGKDFSDFFDIWYYGEGYPIYNFEWVQNVNNKLSIEAEQTSSTSITPFFKMTYDIQLFFSSGRDSIFTVIQDQEKEIFNLSLNEKVTAVIPNPKSSNLMDIQGVYSSLTVPGVIGIEPNPCQERTLIRFSNAKIGRKIKLLNASLQQVDELDASAKTVILNLNTYPSAIYFLYIEDENKRVIKKLIKY